MTVAFIDCETTGLAETADPWEIGVIVRDHPRYSYDGEWLWQVRPNLRQAEPMGLRIGGFYDRFLLDQEKLSVDGKQWRCDAAVIQSPGSKNGPQRCDPETVARTLCVLLDGAVWVGAVPSFDELRIGRFVRRMGYCLTNHYQVIDVEALAAGFIAAKGIDYDPLPPWDSRALTAAIGAVQIESETHTALGDARWAQAVWDAVYGV
jgi:hypothetical protein